MTRRSDSRPVPATAPVALTLALALAAVLAAGASPAAAAAPAPSPGASMAEPADAAALALVDGVERAMGGREAWERTRYLKWRFFGRRLHHWDRYTGDVRIEADDGLVLMNVNTRTGRAWVDGVEIVDPEARREALETGYGRWVNDSYWLVMPWKLRDPGVILRASGPTTLPDGRAADGLVVTFDAGTGLTPRNRYDLRIARDTGLVEEWSYRADVDDPEPAFTLPWAGWTRFGDILLATDHGRNADWEIEVPDSLPREIFQRP